MKIRFNGYYLSEAEPFEDWHAGLKIEHINFMAYCFQPNGRIYIAGKTNENTFKKEDFPINKKPVYYVEDENSIEVVRDKGSIFEVRSKLSKLNDHEFLARL